MTTYLQVLSVHTIDSSPCIVLSSDVGKIMFDCGCGVQRLCVEHKCKLLKLNAVFFTRSCPETLSGLPGRLVLTTADGGKNEIFVGGPAYCKEFWKSVRYFLNRESFKVNFLPDLCAAETCLDEVSVYVNTYGTPTSHVCYICETKRLPGKFNVEKALALRVPKGPSFGHLKNGRSIVLDDGTEISPEQVLEPAELSRYVAIICQVEEGDLNMLDAITKDERWRRFRPLQEHESSSLIDCMVHMSPSGVVRHPAYKDWMTSFGPETTHLLVGEGACDPASSYVAITKYSNKLHSLCPHTFTRLDITNKVPLVPPVAPHVTPECLEEEVRNSGTMGRTRLPEANVIEGAALQRFNLLPSRRRGFVPPDFGERGPGPPLGPIPSASSCNISATTSSSVAGGGKEEEVMVGKEGVVMTLASSVDAAVAEFTVALRSNATLRSHLAAAAAVRAQARLYANALFRKATADFHAKYVDETIWDRHDFHSEHALACLAPLALRRGDGDGDGDGPLSRTSSPSPSSALVTSIPIWGDDMMCAMDEERQKKMVHSEEEVGGGVEEEEETEADDGPLRLWFLGTGCAIPSKYRNVSGIVLQLSGPPVGSMPGDGGDEKEAGLGPETEASSEGVAQRSRSMLLLDVGEGTWEQLKRMGHNNPSLLALSADAPDPAPAPTPTQSDRVALEIAHQLRAVWISHPHADHHLGILRVVAERAKLLGLSTGDNAAKAATMTMSADSGGVEGGDAGLRGARVRPPRQSSLDPLLVIAPPGVLAFLREACVVDPSLHCAYVPVSTRQFDEWDRCDTGDDFWCDERAYEPFAPSPAGCDPLGGDGPADTLAVGVGVSSGVDDSGVASDAMNTETDMTRVGESLFDPVGQGEQPVARERGPGPGPGSVQGRGRGRGRGRWRERKEICPELKSKAASNLRWARGVLTSMGIATLSNVKVHHCSQAYGVAVTLLGGGAGERAPRGPSMELGGWGVRLDEGSSDVSVEGSSDGALVRGATATSEYANGGKGEGEGKGEGQRVLRPIKVVYSGDTRPCDSLVRLGMGATVLIHEATFDDSEADQAVAKRHSTFSEALQVGEAIGAFRTILTHFSQRYQSVPQVPAARRDRAVLAFDFMHVTLRDLLWLPALTPALMEAFPPDLEEATDEAAEGAATDMVDCDVKAAKLKPSGKTKRGAHEDGKDMSKEAGKKSRTKVAAGTLSERDVGFFARKRNCDCEGDCALHFN